MATPKPQRSKEEVEDIILRKNFQITLTLPLLMTTDSNFRVVYLEMTAAEILSEGKPMRLTSNLMESILIAAAKLPFQYLVGCYHRAHDESRKITAMKDKSLKSEMEALTKQANKPYISYCRKEAEGNPQFY